MKPVPRWLARAQSRAERHSRALAAPMTAIPLTGDPRIILEDGKTSPDPVHREMCLYASALMIKRGILPHDASGFDAYIRPPDEVFFIRADGTQDVWCRCKVQIEPQYAF